MMVGGIQNAGAWISEKRGRERRGAEIYRASGVTPK